MNTFKVTDLKKADECLSQIAEATRETKRITTERDEKIYQATLEFEEDLLKLREQVEQHEIALQDFADAKKDLFVEPRSHSLSFGMIGFQKSKKLKTLSKWTWKKVLVALLKRKSRAGLRIKHSINKRILQTWSDDRLKEIGVKRVEEDHFSYSLKEDQI